MYAERRSCLDGAVVWSRTVMPGSGPERVLPDGCMDVIWTGQSLLVAGPDTRAQLTVERPGARFTGLRFGPGTGPAVFGLPAHELRDRRVPLDALWPGAEVRRLAEQVAAAADPGAALELLNARRLLPGWGADPLSRTVVDGLRRGAGVAAVAREAGLSERQLHRRCLDAFGYGAKTLARVLRMRRALRLARDGEPLASVAAISGYADQAHLSREFRALTGVQPSVLVGS